MRTGYSHAVLARAADAWGGPRERSLPSTVKISCDGNAALICSTPLTGAHASSKAVCKVVHGGCALKVAQTIMLPDQATGRESVKLYLTTSQKKALRPGAVLACGGFACVHRTGLASNQVIKFTQDEDDASALARLQGHPSVARVVQISELGRNGWPTGVYAIRMERLYELDDHDIDVLDHLWEVVDILRNRRQGFGTSSYRLSSHDINGFYNVCNHLGPGEPNRRCGAWVQRIVSLHEYAGRRGINLVDFHAGNFMRRRDGTILLVDAGFSRSQRSYPPLLSGMCR